MVSRETGTHSRARGGCHVSTIPGRAVTFNPRLSTRLFLFKFLSKVFNPHLRTRLFFFKSFFEFITYISALGYPLSKSFPQVTNPRLNTKLFHFISFQGFHLCLSTRLFLFISFQGFHLRFYTRLSFSILFKALTHVSALGYLLFRFVLSFNPCLSTGLFPFQILSQGF